MAKFFVITTVSICLLFALTNSTYAKTYKLYDADLIDISAYFKTNVLRIQFSYIDREKSQEIYWKKKTVDCNCVVYGKDENTPNNNEPPILASKRVFLKSYDQKIYIDIPATHSNNLREGFVQCDMAVGWNTFQAKDEFYY